MPCPVLQPPEPKNGKKIKQHRNEPNGVNNGSRKETHPSFIVILRWQKKKHSPHPCSLSGAVRFPRIY